MLIKMCLMIGFDTPMCMLSLHQEGCSTFVGGNQPETLTHTYAPTDTEFEPEMAEH
jgi:carbohydrate-binding DOMON domain-containing protein